MRSEDRNSFDDHFPIRGSALGSCNRQIAKLIDGAQRLELSGERQRIFDVGHQREERLTAALARGLRERGLYFEVQKRVEIPTSIVDDEALRIFDKALDWTGGERGLPPFVAGSALAKTPLRTRVDLDAEVQRLYILGSIDLVIYDVDCEWSLVDGDWRVTGGDFTHDTLHMHPACVVDFKTSKEWAFKKTKSENAPQDHYGVQLSGYGLALEHAGHPAVSMLVYYENKNDQSHCVVPVEWETWRSVAEQQIADKERILRAFDRGELDRVREDYSPKKDGGLPWQCNYCSIGPVNGGCFSEYELVNENRDPLQIAKWKAVPR